VTQLPRDSPDEAHLTKRFHYAVGDAYSTAVSAAAALALSAGVLGVSPP